MIRYENGKMIIEIEGKDPADYHSLLVYSGLETIKCALASEEMYDCNKEDIIPMISFMQQLIPSDEQLRRILDLGDNPPPIIMTKDD